MADDDDDEDWLTPPKAAELEEALDALCRVENFVIHDFRRYLSTTMAKLHVPIDVTEAILNHVSGSRSPIQRVYDRYDRLSEMREALQLYERHLASVVGAETMGRGGGIVAWLRRNL